MSITNTPGDARLRQVAASLAELPAAHMRRLASSIAHEAAAAAPPARVWPEGRYPLSTAQRRLWILQRFDPSDVSYNIAVAVRLTGDLDVTALERALWAVEARHEMLRTTFPLSGQEPVQAVHPPCRQPLQRIDAEHVPAHDRAAWLERTFIAWTRRPFALERLPLLRWVLVRAGAREHVLLIVMHHLLADEWSMGLFVREVADDYRRLLGPDANARLHVGAKTDADAGRAAGADAASVIRCGDYAIWEEESRLAGRFEPMIRDLTEALAGVPPLPLPFDRERPAAPSHRGAVLTGTLPVDASASLRALAAAERTTLFVTLMAAFQAFLHLWTGASDLAVATAAAMRDREMTERMIGFLVSTLVLRVRVEPGDSFRALLRRVHAQAMRAYANQDAPFDLIVERLRLRREFGVTPLFNVMFLFQADTMPALVLPALDAELLPVPRTTSKVDLTLLVRAHGERLVADWNYATDVFDEQTIVRGMTRFGALARDLTAAPDTALSAFRFASARA